MTAPNKPLRVDIWHNILWSKYKGEVFSSLYKLSNKDELDIRFIQIAETEGSRVDLGGVDLANHRYPYTLLFHGSIDTLSPLKKGMKQVMHVLRSDADLFVLFGYEEIACWLQLLLIKLKGKKAAVFCDSTIYDHKQPFVKGLLKRIFFTAIDGVFCYGVRTKEYVTFYGANAETAFYPCQAAALPLNSNPTQNLADRLALAPKTEAPRYLFVGRLSHQKGLDTLLHAFAKVKAQRPAASLILVGSGPEHEALEALSLSLCLGNEVHFAGSKTGTELFKEYTKATCFVLPSRSEPWGLVVNEALAYGCPVIVSECCGCVPELVIEGKTGFTHKVGDADDLAAKMLSAPEYFSNTEDSAKTCIDLMAIYTPDEVAARIIQGLSQISSSVSTKMKERLA